MDRFWSKVDKFGDCWEWTAGQDGSGYGSIRINNKHWRTHRFVLHMEGIKIPSGMCVCHHCDNRICVNPDHLFIGTHADNNADMYNKGRAAAIGEKNPQAKLTDDGVQFIRQSPIQQKQLAQMFSVSDTTISEVKHRKVWSHVK